MIRPCAPADFETMLAIINEAAHAYRGVIPADRWHEPYMTLADLQHEISDGVCFFGCEEAGELVGIMGLQNKKDAALIRHSYTRTKHQRRGIGTRLLRHLESLTNRPVLIGTWAGATWAIRFYEQNGYWLLSGTEKDHLLRTYWTIPDRQVESSVVLANRAWVTLRASGEPCPGA